MCDVCICICVYVQLVCMYMQEDDRRTYYLGGVVWRTLFKDYKKMADTRVLTVIKAQFISRKEARHAKLPVSEVAAKYVPLFFFGAFVRMSDRLHPKPLPLP